MVTQNQNTVTEEEQQKKDTARFWELDKKSDRNDNENTEHGELKTKYANTAKNRIAILSGKEKASAERATEAERLLAEEKARTKELEDKAEATDAQIIVGNKDETIEIGGKKYYTDNALQAQIDAKEITQQAAIDYQGKRNEEKIVVRVKGDFQKEQDAKTISTTREADAQVILKQHPEFSLKHSNHNPNDPLYLQWKELVADGYGTNPQGLTKALKKAKQILGIKDTHIDRSSELGLEDTASPEDKGGDKGKDKEVTLSDVEESSAINMYTSVVNPATNRLYTNDEAVAKAKVAKKARVR